MSSDTTSKDDSGTGDENEMSQVYSATLVVGFPLFAITGGLGLMLLTAADQPGLILGFTATWGLMLLLKSLSLARE